MWTEFAHLIRCLINAEDAYEIKIGENNWSWIVIRHAKYPLSPDLVVKYPGADDKIVAQNDYVIWCECPGGTCRLNTQGNLTMNWWTFQSVHMSDEDNHLSEV